MKMPALLFALPVVALSGGLAGCGVSETDADRFELAASRIAAIPLDPLTQADTVAAQRESAPLRVELLTPHQLWDARDHGSGGTAKVAAPIEADAALLEQTPAPFERAEQEIRPSQVDRMIQLGAYANQGAAQQAWGRLGAVTQGLTPVFEPVSVNGRDVVRLKVRAETTQAQALCAMVAASDSWCLKAAS